MSKSKSQKKTADGHVGELSSSVTARGSIIDESTSPDILMLQQITPMIVSVIPQSQYDQLRVKYIQLCDEKKEIDAKYCRLLEETQVTTVRHTAEIETLKKQLADKDTEIETLKLEIQSQKDEITKLESRIQDLEEAFVYR